LTGVKFEVYVTSATRGKEGVDPLPLGSDLVLSASVRRAGRCMLTLTFVALLALGCGKPQRMDASAVE
jgi:hypothetical protein